MQLSNFLGFHLCALDGVLKINFSMQHSRAKLKHVLWLGDLNALQCFIDQLH